MEGDDGNVNVRRSDPELEATPRTEIGVLAVKLWARAEIEKIASQFSSAGIPVLYLQGPTLQPQLHGANGAGLHDEVELLVDHDDAHAARQLLRRLGWREEEGTRILPLPSKSQRLVKEALVVDLRWSLDPSRVLSWTLRPLQARLWSGAARGESGMLEPDAESWLVYLAIAALSGDRDELSRFWSAQDAVAAARLVRDPSEVYRVARRARARSAVRRTLGGGGASDDRPVLDGAVGRATDLVGSVARGRFIPGRLREETLDSIRLAREGYGYGAFGTSKSYQFDGLELVVPRGVFEPYSITEPVVGVCLESIRDVTRPQIVEIGTGSGAVSLALASHRRESRIHSVDISARAVRCARRNARRLGISGVTFHQGSFVAPLPSRLLGRVDAVVSNVPYVARGFDDHMDAPSTAVTGSDFDGLGVMRVLARALRPYLRGGGSWTFQFSDWQWEFLVPEFEALGYRPRPPAQRLPGGQANVASAQWSGQAR